MAATWHHLPQKNFRPFSGRLLRRVFSGQSPDSQKKPNNLRFLLFDLDQEPTSCLDTIGNSDKVCVDCQTSKTPLWRSGPVGPKSLCNACGIRYRKRSVTGSDKKKVKPLPSQCLTSSSSSTNSGSTMSYRNREMDEMMKSGLRIKVVAVGKEAVLVRWRRSAMKKVKREKFYRKFGEVEEAACLLMSLSGAQEGQSAYENFFKKTILSVFIKTRHPESV